MVLVTGATPPPHTLMPSANRVTVTLHSSVKARVQCLSALTGASESAIGERAITEWIEDHYDQLEAFYSQEVPQS
jgi:predicted transcriptional regulator